MAHVFFFSYASVNLDKELLWERIIAEWDFLTRRLALAASAAAWKRSASDESALLRGKLLEEALAFANERRRDLSAGELHYIDESRAADRRRLEAEELALARLSSLEDSVRKEREAMASGPAHRLGPWGIKAAVGAAAVLVIALIVGITNFRASQNEKANLEKATLEAKVEALRLENEENKRLQRALKQALADTEAANDARLQAARKARQMPQLAQVPKVVGLSVADARKLVENEELVLDMPAKYEESWQVAMQQPPPNAKVARGTRVIVKAAPPPRK